MPLLAAPFAIPLVLSLPASAAFANTSVNTNLFAWIRRHPEIVVTLPEKLEATAPLSQEALLFATANSLLEFDGQGHLRTGQAISLHQVAKVHSSVKTALGHAERLGHWFGSVNSMATIFSCFQITL